MNTPIIFGGNSNPLLTRAVCDVLGVKQGKVLVGEFSDSEERVEIQENVRLRNVFVMQSTSSPAAHHLMELCLMVASAKQADAHRVTAVLPYFGYARQDRRPQDKRTPVTAGFAARMIKLAGADHVMIVEIHASQSLDAFYPVPVDSLYSYPVLTAHMKQTLKGCTPESVAFISPDASGMIRARKYAKSYDNGTNKTQVGMIDKRRDRPNESKAMNVVGDVEGKHCILVDDMADTVGTMAGAAIALREHGAMSVYAYCTHPVLSGSALDNLEKAELNLVTTDTIPLSDKAEASGRIEVVSMAGVIAEAITKCGDGGSIRKMFE